MYRWYISTNRYSCILVAHIIAGGGEPVTPECFSKGSVNPSLLDYDYGLLTSVEGPIEICVDGQYESLCDLGWDENDAKALCRRRIGYNSGM